MGKQRPIDLSAFDEVVSSKEIDLSAFDEVVKKKPSLQGSESISPQLGSGSDPFQNSQVDTKIPSVLSPKGKSEYQEQVKAFKPEEKPKEGQPKPKKADSGLATEFMAGLSNWNAGLFKTPRLIFDAASSITDTALQALNLTDQETDYDGVLESAGYLSPLSVLDRLGDYFSGETNKYEDRKEKFSKGIVDSFTTGEYKQGGKQLLNNIVGSIPSMIGMAVTGGAGNAAKLNYAKKTLANALPFISQKNAELIEDESIPKPVRVANSVFNGYAEVVFDQSFGTQAMIMNVVDVFQKQGKDAAIKVTKDFTKGFVEDAIKKIQPLSGTIKGAVEEMSTQLSQNIVDKYTINPEKELMEGVLDAGLVGGTMTGGIGALGTVAYSSSQKKKVGDLMKQRDEIVDDLDNNNLPDEVKDNLSDKLEKIDNTLSKIDEDGEAVNSNLSEKDKSVVAEKATKIEAIEKSLQDDNISETSKNILADTLIKEQDAIDEILTKPVDKKTEVKEVVAESIQSPVSEEVNPAIQEIASETPVIEEMQDTEQIINDEQETQTESQDQRSEPARGSDTAVQKEVIPLDTFQQFEDIINNTKSFEEAYKVVKNTRDVPKEVADAFGKKYNPNKDLLQKQAFAEYYNEVKAKTGAASKQPIQSEIKENSQKAPEKALTSKAGDPLRNLADKIEQGKINKLGGFRASTGFDAVWDGSLTVVAQSLRGGAKLADAIESGLKHVRQTDWYKELTDKKDFESQYKAHLEKEYEVDTTTLRNADVEQKRAADYRFNEPLPKTTVTNEETLGKAIKAIKENGQVAYDVIDKSINKEPLTATEMAILAQFQGTKEAELIRANEKIEQSKDSSVLAFNNAMDTRNKIIDDLVMAYDASELSGTTAGRALQARKIKVLQDYSLAGMLIRIRKANDNKQLTNEQIADITNRYEALVKAEAKLNAKIEKLQEENSKLKLKEFTPRIRVESAKEARENRRTQTKETLKKERESIFEEMRKLAKKSRGELSANPIKAEMIPLIGKLAKNYFIDGMTSIEAIVDKIHGDLVDIVEEVTKRDVRDAISGYNRDTRPTKDDLYKDIQDLKTQARLISQIEDAENGVKKAKTEVKHAQASEEVEMLRARLKDLTKGETSLENLKYRVKKQISDTQKRLDNKDYSKKESDTVILDEEARKLQDAYRKIKFDFDVAVAKDKLANRTKGERLKDLFIEVANIPRALMATADLSAPLRQGIIPTISNPIMAKRAFVEMVKQWGNEGRAERWLADLKDSPGYQLMKDADLYIADKANPDVKAKEEDFQTNLAEKIPGFGVLVKASERAYISYLNKMRVDLFSKGVGVLQDEGISYASNPEAYKSLASYINASTGRGSMGDLERAAPVLNTAFFSPRLMASRLQLLSGYPLWAKGMPKEVKKMYLKDMAKFISFGVGILAISVVAGADVEDDPRSPDFGKIKKDNTRWDIWGGFQQFVRYFSQIALGEKKSSASGKITPLDGTSYTKETRGSVALDLVRSKLAPVPAFVVNWFAGSNMVGDPFDASKDIPNMLFPLVWQGIYDSYKQDGLAFALGATGVPSVLGVGVQTYGVNDFLQQGVDDRIINLLVSKKAVAMEPREGDRKIYDIKDGGEREMTDAEFKKYYATWVDGIKQGLTEDYTRLSKLTHSQFEKEFRSIKTRASKDAKEAVIGLPLELKNFREDDISYELNPDQLKVRNNFYKEYIEDNKGYYESDKESQGKLTRKAREYSKKQLKAEGYAPDAEGKFKLMVSE